MLRINRSRFPALRFFVRAAVILTAACGCLAAAAAFGQESAILAPAPNKSDVYRGTSGRDHNNSMSALLDSQNERMNQLVEGIATQLFLDAKARELRVLRQGAEKIKNGAASTRINTSQPSPFVRKFAETIVDQRQKAAFENDANQAIKRFRADLARLEFDASDVADARALAFAMSYEALHEIVVPRAHLRSLREVYRKQLLADARFQGATNDEQYTNFGFLAFCAAKAREILDGKDAATQTLSVAEKKTLARAYAVRVLNSLTGGIGDDIELTPDGFGSRAERLIRERKTTATFERSREFLTINDWAKRSLNVKNIAYFEQALRRFDTRVVESGGTTDDLAWANTTAFAIYYSIVNNEKHELNKAQIESVQTFMERDIKESVALQRMTNEQKQKYYENIGVEVAGDFEQYRINQQRINTKLQPPFDKPIRELGAANLKIVQAKAAAKLREIFEPRSLDDYQLTETGIIKK